MFETSGDQIWSLRVKVQPGFLSYWAKNTSTRESGIAGESVYLVGQKSWLDWCP